MDPQQPTAPAPPAPPPPPPAPTTEIPPVASVPVTDAPEPQDTPPAPVPPQAPNPNTKYIIAGATIVVILILFGIGFFYYQKTQLTTAPVATSTPLATATPSTSSIPATPSSIPSDWKTYQFDSIKMTLQAPPTLTVTEYAPNPGTGTTIFIQNYGYNSPMPTGAYQLYIVYQTDPPTTQAELEAKRGDLEPTTIQEVTVDGYKGFRGQIKGERNRYVTYFLKGSALFSGFTSEPTKENEALSNQIISTINFTDN